MNALAIEANTLLDARYRLVEPARDRGAGEVWRVRDERRDGAMLLAKFFRPTHGGALPPAALLAVRTLGSLRHPAVPAALDHGAFARRPWVITEDAHGSSLGALFDRARASSQTLDLALVRGAFSAVASALSAAHSTAPALVHGAITPGSVIALSTPTSQTAYALLDLGIAPWLDAPSDAHPRSARVLIARAPETFTGGAATVATDVFSLGALLAELLTLPAEPGATLSAASESNRRPDVPASVWSVISTAMAPSPRDRYPSVSSLAAALDHAWRLGERSPLTPQALLEAVIRSSSGASQAPLAKAPEALKSLPLSALGAFAPPPLSAPTGGPPRVSHTASAAPSGSNPWATEVRLREVPVPAAMAVAGDSDQTLIAAPKPRPVDDGGETWIAAPRPAPTPTETIPFAAAHVPMNVPDATLVAPVPVARPAMQQRPIQPAQPYAPQHVQPYVPPPVQPIARPASRSSKAVTAAVVVVFVVALIAALKQLG